MEEEVLFFFSIERFAAEDSWTVNVHDPLGNTLVMTSPRPPLGSHSSGAENPAKFL